VHRMFFVNARETTSETLDKGPQQPCYVTVKHMTYQSSELAMEVTYAKNILARWL